MSPSSAKLADHETPFVWNEWYVAALSDEIGQFLFNRRIMGISVLMYRRADGKAVAMQNRCPHRSFPLSRGILSDDRVICGYHGLAFNSDGRCVVVPSQSSVPEGLVTTAYLLVERSPFIWIWMGDPRLADASSIPDHHWLGDPGYAGFSDYLHCRANYIRLHENVLDLTHFPYVHGDAVGGEDYLKAPATVERHGDKVVITRKLYNRPIPDTFGHVIGNVGNLCNRTSESWFMSPGFHLANATFEDLEGGVSGKTEFNFKIMHFFTPETAHSTHYFFGNARDAAINNELITQKFREVARSTFLEDEQALELVEDMWISDDSSQYRELNLRGDLGGLHMRRIIADRARSEVAARHAR